MVQMGDLWHILGLFAGTRTTSDTCHVTVLESHGIVQEIGISMLNTTYAFRLLESSLRHSYFPTNM